MRPGGYVSGTFVQQIAYTPYGNASGGSSSAITVSGQSYTLLTFTSDGTLTVNRSGLFDLLLVGGGGGGAGRGGASDAGGGGGGGGGIFQDSVYLAAGSYTVDVGAGGAGTGAGSQGGGGYALGIQN